MSPATTRLRNARGRAFTLVEVVVSLVILSILMLACVGVLVLAQRSLDLNRPDGPVAQPVEAREAADLLTSDLRMATSVLQQTATSTLFTVPDRTGDGVPETLLYAWSGTPGDPLTRSYNGGTAAAILKNVRSLSLGYRTRDTGPAARQESAELVLFYHNDATGGTMKDYTLDPNTWCGTYVKPTLAANVVSWRITRIYIVAKREGTVEGYVVAELRHADSALKPLASVIDGGATSEYSLASSYAWSEVTFANASGLDPSKGYCLVIRQAASSSPAAKVQWEDYVTETDNRRTVSTDAGVSWSTPDTTKHLRLYVFGTVTTQ